MNRTEATLRAMTLHEAGYMAMAGNDEESPPQVHGDWSVTAWVVVDHVWFGKTVFHDYELVISESEGLEPLWQLVIDRLEEDLFVERTGDSEFLIPALPTYH